MSIPPARLLVPDRPDGRRARPTWGSSWPADRRGDHLARLDGPLPGHGHRHGQADRRAAAAVPHHLVDVIEPHEEYSLAEYVGPPRMRVAEIRPGAGRSSSWAERPCT